MEPAAERSRRERAILVGLERKAGAGSARDGASGSSEESLQELATLAQSAGAEVLGLLLQSRAAPEAATLIGSGKVQELARWVEAEQADLVIFDQDLTPTQQRNLEQKLGCKVIDRTQLILDIFARRARTREGQLQVELAQLNYLLPRLTGRGVELSRLGGGIGTRGPGETQLETDRRRIRRRIRKLERELEAVRTSRAVQRGRRQAAPLQTAALVGYTNAGKSTLFNRLTGAEVLVDARLFATLDPTVRLVTLPSHRRILLSDTVGFIRKLPVTLVKAFRATLEEVVESSLILHVVDVAAAEAAAHVAQVEKVLSEIGAAEIPRLLVLNKIDLAPEAAVDPQAWAARAGGPAPVGAVAVSARTGQGLDRLLEAIDRTLASDSLETVTFRFPAGEISHLSRLYEFGRVLAVRYDERGCEVRAEVPRSWRARLAAYVAEPG